MSINKIHIKKIRNIFVWTFVLMSIFVLLCLGIDRKGKQAVDDLIVDIIPVQGDEALISEKEVRNMVYTYAGSDIKGRNIFKLNLRKLETKLNRDKRIARADVYIDGKNKLHIRVEQKKPLMRIMETSGVQYYLDDGGKKIPVTVGSAIRVPVVTGLRGPFKEDFLSGEKPSKWKEVFSVVKYVSADPFLSALIEQVHVSPDSLGDLILVPKVGREQILLGDASELNEKFDKLKIFYRDGMPRLGWQRYTRLNLKVTGQVVGTLTEVALAERKAYSQDSLQAGLAPGGTNGSSESIHQ